MKEVSILRNHSNNQYDLVCIETVEVGDEVIIGYDLARVPITRHIKTVHEQRKEKGTYIDELNRRWWARVS